MDIRTYLNDQIDRLQTQKNLLKRIDLYYREFLHGATGEECSKSAKKLHKLVKSYFDIYVMKSCIQTLVGSKDWQMCEQINREIARYLDEDEDD
jgi:hypothetical protein